MNPRNLIVLFAGVFLLITPAGFAGVNIWTPFGPEGVEVSALAADPLAPGTIYVGCRNGDGVHKSTDGGQNWGPPMNNGLPVTRILAIAVSPWTAGEVYAATSNLEIYMTTDGGLNWELASADVAPTYTSDASLVFAPDPTPRIYWAWYGVRESTRVGGVFMREEGGSSWLAVDTDLGGQPVNSFAYAPEDPPYPPTLYAGMRDGKIFRSENNGASWVNTNAGVDELYGQVAVDPADPSTVYASARFLHVYRSDDRGDTWAPVSDVPRWMFDLWVHPSDHSVYGIGRDEFESTPSWRTNLFRSVDGGVNWENLTPDMYGARNLAFGDEAGTECYAAIENGIWAYADGGSGMEWQPRMGGLRAHNIYSVAYAPSNPSFLYVGTSFTGVYRSTDGGATFEPIVDGLVNRVGSYAIAVDPLDHERVYADGQTVDSLQGIGHDLVISSDAGTIWQSVPPQDPPISEWGSSYDVEVDSADPLRIMITAGYFPTRVVRSIDGGATFQEIDSGFDDCIWVNRITITPDAVYAGCDSDPGLPVLFKSTDDGLTWLPCSSGLEGENGAEILAVDPFDPGKALVGTWEGVFRTSTGGLGSCTWEAAGGGLPVEYVRDLVFDPDVPGTAYAALAGSGVYRTLDHGSTWEEMSTGLNSDTARRAMALSIDPADSNHLVVGTSQGLFVFSIETSDEDADGVLGSVEDANPDGPDGNGDGINDSEQDNVTSLPTTEGPYVTIAAPEGTSLAGVKATSAGDAPDPPPGEAAFPLGMLEFTVTGLPEGGSVDIVLHLPPGMVVNSFWKYNSTLDNFAPHWYEFIYDGETGAEILSDRIVLHFVDGQRGDDDLMVNGTVTEPGAPSLVGTMVAIDVLPGSRSNPINLTSRGKTPVAVLTAEAFDAIDVNPPTVVLAGASPLRWAWEDVDHDGDVDLILKFKTRDLELTVNSTEVVLVGETLGGTLIWGSDVVRIVN